MRYLHIEYYFNKIGYKKGYINEQKTIIKYNDFCIIKLQQ